MPQLIGESPTSSVIMINTKWAQPQEVTQPELVFGGDMNKLLPAMDDIPKEFWRHRGTRWNQVVSTWFFDGLPEGTEFKPKPGIREKMALMHLQAIMRSWAPKHEHKEAGVAYLMSLWFDDVIITEKKA